MPHDMPATLDERAGAASDLLGAALGDWWRDDRRHWCAYCGIAMKQRSGTGKPIPPQKATRDHVIPRKHGGGGSIRIPACLACNQAKGALSVPEFLRSAYFEHVRTRKHRHQWPVAHLWLVTALAAMQRSGVTRPAARGAAAQRPPAAA
jgi:hypothetical protein